MTMQPGLMAVYGDCLHMSTLSTLGFDNCTLFNISTNGHRFGLIFAVTTDTYWVRDSFFMNIHNIYNISMCIQKNCTYNALFFATYLSNFTFIRSTFVMISSPKHNLGGGAIYCSELSKAGSLVEDCEFWNLTSRFGAALYVGATRGSILDNAVTVKKSSFVRCSATGVLYLDQSSEWHITDCIFSNLFNPYYDSLNGEYGGAAISAMGSRAFFVRCSFVRMGSVCYGSVLDGIGYNISMTDCVYAYSYRPTPDPLSFSIGVFDVMVYGSILNFTRVYTTQEEYQEMYDCGGSNCKVHIVQLAYQRKKYGDTPMQTCTTLNANKVTNGVCSWPCSADFSLGASGTCVLPGTCAGGFIDVGGKCVPPCSYWLGPKCPTEDLHLKYCRLDASLPGPMMYVARDTADMHCISDSLHNGTEFVEDGLLRCALKENCTDREFDPTVPAPCGEGCYAENGTCVEHCDVPEHYREGTCSGYCELKTCRERTLLSSGPDGPCGNGCVVNKHPGDLCVSELTEPTEPTPCSDPDHYGPSDINGDCELLPCHLRRKNTLNPLQPCGPPDLITMGCLWDLTAEAAPAVQECYAVEDLTEKLWGWNITNGTCWEKSICTDLEPDMNNSQPCGFNDFCFLLSFADNDVCGTVCPVDAHYNGTNSGGRCVMKGCSGRTPIEGSSWPCGYEDINCFKKGNICVESCGAFASPDTLTAHECRYTACPERKATAIKSCGGGDSAEAPCFFFDNYTLYPNDPPGDVTHQQCVAQCPEGYSFADGAIPYCTAKDCLSRNSSTSIGCSLPGDDDGNRPPCYKRLSACVVSCPSPEIPNSQKVCTAPTACASRLPTPAPTSTDESLQLNCLTHDACYYFADGNREGWSAYPPCNVTCPINYQTTVVYNKADGVTVESYICQPKPCTARQPLSVVDCTITNDTDTCYRLIDGDTETCTPVCPEGFETSVRYGHNNEILGFLCSAFPVQSRDTAPFDWFWVVLIVLIALVVVVLAVIALRCFCIMRKANKVDNSKADEVETADGTVEVAIVQPDESIEGATSNDSGGGGAESPRVNGTGSEIRGSSEKDNDSSMADRETPSPVGLPLRGDYSERPSTSSSSSSAHPPVITLDVSSDDSENDRTHGLYVSSDHDYSNSDKYLPSASAATAGTAYTTNALAGTARSISSSTGVGTAYTAKTISSLSASSASSPANSTYAAGTAGTAGTANTANPYTDYITTPGSAQAASTQTPGIATGGSVVTTEHGGGGSGSGKKKKKSSLGSAAVSDNYIDSNTVVTDFTEYIE